MDAAKRCCPCHHVRPVADFNVRVAAADGLQSRCGDCSRQWYVADRDAHRAKVRLRSTAIEKEYKRRIGGHLLAHPCVDCGESDVRVLDFDHLRPPRRLDEALRHRQDGQRGRAWSDIELQIAQCEVRCANCHRRVTSDRGQDWRAVVAAEVRAASADVAVQRLARLLASAEAPPALRRSR